MRDMRGERTPRAGIREERLRATAGLREPPALSSWRGRSGRRYVVGVHPLAETEMSDVTDAVMIAVQRGGDGVAAVIDVAEQGAGQAVGHGLAQARRARLRWLSSMRARGATEVHVHRLAHGDAERRAVVEDLVESGV